MEKKKINLIEKLKNKKKLLIIIIILAIIILLLLTLSTVFALINMGNSNIMKGVFVNEIDLSGMSQNEAKDKIEALVKEKIEKEINLTYGEYNSTINASIMELEYDVNSAIEEAYAVGRSSNIIRNNYEILNTMLNKKNIDINIKLNEETTKNTIKDMSANIPNAIVQSSYYIEDNQLIITKGKKGEVIDEEKFINRIKDNYSDLVTNKNDIDLPIEEKEPDAIDIDKIHEEIYKEAKDAYYNEEPFEIFPEIEGVDFNIDEARAKLQNDQEEYTIDLIITKPKVTINDLSEIAFKDVISTFSTKYDASNTDRTTNLRLAAKKINGTVLGAGVEFSYNKTVGERSIAAGYKEAKIYSNGEVVDGLGGGICQISSTLYNAAVIANLDITQRRNHQFVTSYLPAGRDATVVYGSQDFKFKNSRKYPIKLEASVANGIAKITIYGIKEDTEYDISLQTNTISTIPFATSYEEDSSIPTGTEKIKQKGTNGLVTETYKIMKSGGKVVSKTLLSKDVYNAMQRIVIMGTGVATEPETTVTQTPEPTQPITPSVPMEQPEKPTQSEQTETNKNEPEKTEPETE